uniref:Uncharacterized protein n=1 Tax=Aegilops tauschii subsp. strangulata TaxID=200361 RepID=A0A453CYG1_AEGTS
MGSTQRCLPDAAGFSNSVIWANATSSTWTGPMKKSLYSSVQPILLRHIFLSLFMRHCITHTHTPELIASSVLHCIVGVAVKIILHRSRASFFYFFFCLKLSIFTA